MSLKLVVEALLFASQKPLMPKEIVSALRGATDFSDDPDVVASAAAKEAEVATALNELRDHYLAAGHAFQLIEQVNGWQLTTRPQYAVWVRQLFPEGKPSRLSPPALETLAIIAYRQPIVKADIEAVRGVAVDGMMQKLLDGGLIKIAGRADIPGRPLLYETTQFFLERFGLKTLDELPNASVLRQVKLPKAPTTQETIVEQLPLQPQIEVQEEPRQDASSNVEPAEIPLS